MRRLIRSRPDIDLAGVKEPPFEAERSVVIGPGFDDQVQRFELSFVHAHRVAVGGRNLIRHAAHEPGFQPAAGQHVDHRHFFRDAHRLAAVGDRVAQDQQTGLVALPCQHGEHQRRRRIDAGRGLVMLIEHDVEAFVLGEQPFVEIAMVQIGSDARIVMPVRQRNPDGIRTSRPAAAGDRRSR